MLPITKSGKIIIFLICAAALVFFGSVFFVKAENAGNVEEYSIEIYNAEKILKEGVEGNYKPAEGLAEITKENADEQFYAVIGRWVELALSFIGIILIILIIYAGYLWFMSDGNEEQIGQAKSYMTNAIIGTVIVLLAYAITYFIMGRISGTIRNL